jgi:peptidoglycan/LPS O-acetylase OafA/YrhL
VKAGAPASLTYPRLDGLRAIAVLAVIAEHTVGIDSGTHLFDVWLPGAAGVRLFFVLSGFLITGILWRARSDAEGAGTSQWSIVRAFYVRRALRILPLAYGALLVAWAFGSAPPQVLLTWYASYAANFRHAFWYGADPGLGHFWSLAIEEQFYLVWPFIVVFAPRSIVVPVLLAAIGSAVVSRAVMMIHGGQVLAYTMLPSRMDALAAGGLLAVVESRLAPALLLLIASGSVGIGWVGWHGHTPLSDTIAELSSVCLSAAVVLFAARPSTGRRTLLAIPPLSAVGRISYGMYVWHVFVMHMPGIRLPVPGWGRFAFVTACTAAIATVTWCAFERPLNNLKRYWPYVRPAERSPVFPDAAGIGVAASRRFDAILVPISDRPGDSRS